MTSQNEHGDITLDVEKGITPHELAEMLAEQGVKPLLHHASTLDLGRSLYTPKFEDGVDIELKRMLERYYTNFLSNPDLGQSLAKIRLRLVDWTAHRGVEVAEVDLRNLAEDGHTHLHQPDEFQDQSSQPRISVFMPPKIPGPNVALHNPFGAGRIAVNTNRPIGGDILRKGLKPPINRSIVQDAGEILNPQEERIQGPGETLFVYAPVHSSKWSTGHHRHQIPDFDKLSASQTPYHEVIGLSHKPTPPVAMFSRRLKE